MEPAEPTQPEASEPTHPGASEEAPSHVTLRDLIEEDVLRKRAQDLQDIAYQYANIGKNRATGSLGHRLTVQYIYEQFLEFSDYYTVELQDFTLRQPFATLWAGEKEVYANYVLGSPFGVVTSFLTAVDDDGYQCPEYEKPSPWSIHLISIDGGTVGDKVEHAAAHGAVGVILYNGPGEVGATEHTIDGAREPPSSILPIPTVIISYADAQRLSEMLSDGVHIFTQMLTGEKDVSTQNLIAQTKSGDPNNVLFIGAHSDSVPSGPGINDNGSGMLGILEVACQLTKFTVKNAVRFGFWAAEETGQEGSHHYVQQLSEAERRRIKLYLNFDMIASPNYTIQLYKDGPNMEVPGTAEAFAELVKYFDEITQLRHSLVWDLRCSDHVPHFEAGIAIGGIFTGAEAKKQGRQAELFGGRAGESYDPNYHTALDTVENLNYGIWVQMTKAIAHMVTIYAGL
jgi:hypothetical protein